MPANVWPQSLQKRRLYCPRRPVGCDAPGPAESSGARGACPNGLDPVPVHVRGGSPTTSSSRLAERSLVPDVDFVRPRRHGAGSRRATSPTAASLYVPPSPGARALPARPGRGDSSRASPRSRPPPRARRNAAAGPASTLSCAQGPREYQGTSRVLRARAEAARRPSAKLAAVVVEISRVDVVSRRRATARTQVRWSSPTWSTRTCPGSTSRRNVANWKRWNPDRDDRHRPTPGGRRRGSAWCERSPTGTAEPKTQAPTADSSRETRPVTPANYGQWLSASASLLAPGPPRRRSRTRGARSARRAAPSVPDTDLDEHEGGPLDGSVEIPVSVQLAAEAVTREHPPGEPADDLEPLRVDVLQNQLGHAQPLASRASPETSSGV